MLAPRSFALHFELCVFVWLLILATSHIVGVCAPKTPLALWLNFTATRVWS